MTTKSANLLSAQSTAQNTSTTLAWYQQFWPWFLILLPLSAVIAGIATLIIAENVAHHDNLTGYRKVGIAIVSEPAPATQSSQQTFSQQESLQEPNTPQAYKQE